MLGIDNSVDTPILPYPHFLSTPLGQFIDEIACQTGRHVLFVDLQKMGSVGA